MPFGTCLTFEPNPFGILIFQRLNLIDFDKNQRCRSLHRIEFTMKSLINSHFTLHFGHITLICSWSYLHFNSCYLSYVRPCLIHILCKQLFNINIFNILIYNQYILRKKKQILSHLTIPKCTAF